MVSVGTLPNSGDSQSDFGCAIEPTMAAMRQHAAIAANFADDIHGIYDGAQPADILPLSTRTTVDEARKCGLSMRAHKSTLLVPTQQRADELSAAYDEEQAAAGEDAPIIKPNIITHGHLVSGIPVGTPAYVAETVAAKLGEAMAMARSVLEATSAANTRGPAMERQAALAVMTTCVLPKVTYLARALGGKIREQIASLDVEMAGVIRQILGLPADDAADSHDQKLLWDKVTEARSKHGLGVGPAGRMLDAGAAACAAATAAALLARLGPAVAATTAHTPQAIGVLPAAHGEGIERLEAAGISQSDLDRIGVSEDAIAAAGANGSGKGSQRRLTQRLGAKRDKERAADTEAEPLTRMRLAAGGGHGLAAAHASRRVKGNRMGNDIFVEMVAEITGRDMMPEAGTCPNCTGILDRQGQHALGCNATKGLRSACHDGMCYAIFRAMERGSNGTGAVLEPHLNAYPGDFGPLKAGADDIRPDVLIIDAKGGHLFIDATIGFKQMLDPMEELLNPGIAEEQAHARKYKHYDDACTGAGNIVHTLFVGAHGDITGGGRRLLTGMVRQRAEERESKARRADENWTYNNQISALRCAMSVAFWRARAGMRLGVRTPRASWMSVGLHEAKAPQAHVMQGAAAAALGPEEEEGGEGGAGIGAACA